MKKIVSASIVAMGLALTGPALAQSVPPLPQAVQTAISNAGNNPVQAIEGLVEGASQGDVADLVRVLSQAYPAQADVIALTALNASSDSFLNAIAAAAVNGAETSGADAGAIEAEILEIAAALRQRLVGQLEQNPNANQGTVDIVNNTIRSLNAAVAAATDDPNDGNVIYVAELSTNEIPLQVAENTIEQPGDEEELETGNLANNEVNNLAQNNQNFGNFPSFVDLPSQGQASGN